MGDNIVISFSNKDRAFVEALAELLNQRLSRYRTVRGDEAGDGRPRVWIYPQQTDGSRHIIEIHRQLEQALAVIVILSDHSAASRWVLEEVQFAWNANKLIIPIAVGDRDVIKPSDPGVLLRTRTWIYASEVDRITVADSIIKTLEEEKLIRPAEIGSRYRHRRQLTTRPTGGYFEATRDDDERLLVVKEVANSDREVLRDLDAKVAQLRNPALPLIEDYLQEEGRRYIVWEEMPGRSLADQLAAQRGQPLAWADIQPWVDDALVTLAFLHQAKVLHLGLKPQNLKRTRDGQIKLLDLGLDRRPAGEIVGTTDPYLAPELLDERDPSPRSDLYAFGALLYTLLTGDTQPSPLKPSVARRNRAVPEHVSQAIAKAMSAEPAQRFRSANEFLVALGGAPVPIAGAPQLPKWLLPVGGAVAVVVAVLVAVQLFIGVGGSGASGTVPTIVPTGLSTATPPTQISTVVPPSPTSIPTTPPAALTFYDDFNDPTYIGKWNEGLWTVWNKETTTIEQTAGGFLALSRQKPDSGGLSRSSLTIEEIGFVEAKLKLDENTEASHGAIAFTMKTGDGKWWLNCAIDSRGDSGNATGSCFNNEDNSRSISLPFNTWHTFRFEMHPETAE